MKTPFDYLTSTINRNSLSDAYKIGFKAGIKEVVDFLRDNCFVQNTKETMAWQSKLKEWGYNG